jgi:hypothetical protein
MLRTHAALALASLVASTAAARTDTSALGITLSGQVVRFDGSVASATLVGTCGYGTIGDMVRTFDGRFLASSGGSATTAAKLIEIDPATGAGTLLGSMPILGELRGIAVESEDALLVLARTTVAKLYRVDLSTFGATLIAPTSYVNLQALVLDTRGRAFAWDTGSGAGTGDGLIQIFPHGGASFDPFPAVDGDSSIQALAVDGSGALRGVRSQLFDVSCGTGAISLLAGTTAFDIRGLAYEHGATFLDGMVALRSDGTLYRVNASTGASSVATVFGSNAYCALTREFPLNRLLAARAATSATTQFLALDLDTGAATPLGTAPLANVRGIAEKSGVVYAVTDESSASDRLWTVDPDNGVTSLVGSTGLTSVLALAAGEFGDLFAWDGVLGLVRVSSTTAVSVDVNTLFNGLDIPALAFDPRGHLFAIDGVQSGQFLFEFNPMTGTPSLPISSLSFGDVRGAAFLSDYAFVEPRFYCTAQTNSSGCTPHVFTGGNLAPSATFGSGFSVKAGNVLAGKTGVLFYGYARNATPFLGGTLCVAQPIHRAPPQVATAGVGCSSVLSYDFNELVASGADPTLVAGALVDAQWWSRDPAAPSTTNLTDAVEFEIAP